jgi:V/A-type H+/Na+-transporting ATPase subunit E
MSALQDILKEEAQAEINRILSDSDSQAETIIQEAETKASTRLEIHRRKVEAQIRAAKNRAEGTAELAVATARIQAKGEVIALVRKKALGAIEDLAGTPGYRKILTALANEAIGALAAAEAVVVNPKEKAILKHWAVQRRIAIRTDPKLSYGVRLVSRSSRRSVENSLAERLNRSWDLLSARVAQILWE